MNGHRIFAIRLLPFLFATLFWLVPVRSSAQGSVYLAQVIPLLPGDAVLTDVLDETETSEMIDQAVLEILSTETGKVFCGALSEDFQVFRRAFFVNQRMAEKGYRICRGRFSEKMIHLPFRKKYFIVSTAHLNFSADGWTTPRNETFLFLSNQEPRRKTRILRTIAHELAVSFDRKEQLGFGGEVLLRQFGVVRDHQTCSLIPIIRDGAFKQMLSAVRAFDIEQRILNELKLEIPQAFREWDSLSCIDRLRKIEPYIAPLDQSFAAETLVNSMFDVTSCMAPVSFDEKLKAFEQIKLNFKDSETVTACEYLGRGWPYLPGVSFRGGPGPRIGGGGW